MCACQANAEAITGEDAQAMRSVVQIQLGAFAADDAALAFSLATAATRDMLQDADVFLEMVRHRYPALLNHRLALFSEPELIDGHALIAVRLTDTDDAVWIAVYELIPENDGSWKIETCNLIEAHSTSI